MAVNNGIFSSSDERSYGRIASFMCLICLLVWSSIILYENNEIPDIPTNWFALVCIPFAISKTGETVKAIYGKKEEVCQSQ